jgi:hypothetical protein
MNFELLPIMQIRKKGGWNFKKIFSCETTEPISTNFAEMILVLGGPLPKLCPAFQNSDQDGHHSWT